MPAMRHEAERGRVLARELVEVLAHRRALLRDAHDVGGRILHAGDVVKLEQPHHGVDRHVDHRARRNIVDDDRDADRVVDRLEVLIEPFLRGLVVIGRDDQHGVGAAPFPRAGRARSPPWWNWSPRRRSPERGPLPARCTTRPPACAPRARASGFRRWCRPERARWSPRRSANRPARGRPSRRPSRF